MEKDVPGLLRKAQLKILNIGYHLTSPTRNTFACCVHLYATTVWQYTLIKTIVEMSFTESFIYTTVEKDMVSSLLSSKNCWEIHNIGCHFHPAPTNRFVCCLHFTMLCALHNDYCVIWGRAIWINKSTQTNIFVYFPYYSCIPFAQLFTSCQNAYQ